MNRTTPLLFTLAAFGIVSIGGLTYAFGWHGTIISLVCQAGISVAYHKELLGKLD